MENLVNEGYFSLEDLDQVCRIAKGNNSEQNITRANQILYNFQQRPDAYMYALQYLLIQGTCNYCKVTMCKSLENFVDKFWISISPE